MPRRKTKGDPISLRFSIERDEKLRRLAADREMTPAEYVIDRFGRALDQAK